MTYQISEKTQDILDAVIEWGGKTSEYPYLVKSQILTIPKYNFSTSKKSNLFEFICTKQEYDDFVSGLIHYAGKNYYEQYLNSTRTPLEPKIKDAEFEHGEELRLEHAKDLVVYMADCTAYEGFCIVLIDNTPERVNNLYLSRPETAEQKAAKERGIAITEMVSIVAENMFTGSLSQSNKNCTDLYDAGYRK